ncbi:MAG: DegT/DnrJ/EryC1/StrS family aminotransferase, partial [Candidatus Staskawiczbacteria bacterium]|nr:DegT/DnrJ/EryC1/StrS family aminotransferase [Candidatus Staskawiczbacteria bacterium]
SATMCLTKQTIKKAITKKTKAILYVCAYGNVSDLDAMASYAKSQKIFLINDCAPALFGSYKNRPIASYGDFSVLSFFADKTITTGEGGMLLSNNIALINKVNMYKHDGRRERGVDVIEYKGYNFRITELQAAVGVAQLKKAAYFVKRKKEILRSYSKKLSGINSVRLFTFNSDGAIVPHRVVIFVPSAKHLIAYLASLGIGVRNMFMPMHSMPAYDTKGDFPNTQEIFKTGVCLPSAPSLTDKNIEFICQSIKKFYA